MLWPRLRSSFLIWRYEFFKSVTSSEIPKFMLLKLQNSSVDNWNVINRPYYWWVLTLINICRKQNCLNRNSFTMKVTVRKWYLQSRIKWVIQVKMPCFPLEPIDIQLIIKLRWCLVIFCCPCDILIRSAPFKQNLEIIYSILNSETVLLVFIQAFQKLLH